MERTFFEWIVLYWVNYWPLLLKGSYYTVLLAIIGTIIGFLIGLIVSVICYIPITKNDSIIKRIFLKVTKALLNIYIEIFRATPMIVQAMIIFYGAWYMNIPLKELLAGFIVISVNTGAYMAEIVRGGFISIDKGQTEGAQSLGMTHWQTMINVIIPQAVRNIMPSIGNEFIINIKDSAVLSVISVSELFFAAKSAAGTYLNYFPIYVIACAIYFVLTFSVSRILKLAEKKMDGPSSYLIVDANESQIEKV